MTTKHTITTNLFPELSYARHGTGPAIMLLHGFPVSGSLWNALIPALSKSHTLLIPDIPGAGDSRLGKNSVSIDDLATIVPEVLDDAGIAQCVLAGHSMGGYISLAVAERYADRLLGLSLVHSTAKADDEEKKAKRRKSIALIRKGGRKEFVKGMIPLLFSDEFKISHPETIQTYIEEGLKLPDESVISFYNAMIDRPERLNVLSSVPFPVQWILGKEDSTIPWRSTLQQSSVPDVSFVEVYESCAHMSMIEQKELLQEDLLKFVGYCLQTVEDEQ